MYTPEQAIIMAKKNTKANEISSSRLYLGIAFHPCQMHQVIDSSIFPFVLQKLAKKKKEKEICKKKQEKATATTLFSQTDFQQKNKRFEKTIFKSSLIITDPDPPSVQPTIFASRRSWQHCYTTNSLCLLFLFFEYCLK